MARAPTVEVTGHRQIAAVASADPGQRERSACGATSRHAAAVRARPAAAKSTSSGTSGKR